MDHVNELGDALPAQASDLIHVEVCKTQNSIAKDGEIQNLVLHYLETVPSMKYGDIYTDFAGQSDIFTNNIDHIVISESSNPNSVSIDKSKVKMMIHVYTLNTEGAASEEIEEEEDISAANHWILPSSEFEGLWENLIFDHDVKQQLLNYSSTTLLFSDKEVDPNIIAWNRVVLLHGPPGTGKTSLCKALAQKLTIRHSNRFRYGQLIEINSHSLFSKWFSESGKLVMKMFQRIQELIDDPSALVCVLIDEVESLTAARTAAMKGTEPSDAIRVVNALLTQIDQIRKYPNVMILTTSNITGAIDLAFVDRKSCGLSGRTLRKLPFLTHALFLQGYTSFTQEQFIAALSRCVDKQLADRELLASEIQKQYDNNSSEHLLTPKKTVSGEEREHIHTNGIIESR
ncbi:pachytene checkpoint protein 2 homolog isoform X2 [Clytia hemisphaerica]|uniref:pachytene checkpoint protein 2 homolog isoform X2 n=1 Tax=Clytia hemisphaerica TaxID=252671 RepID=UPI0034D58FE0